MSLLWQKEGVRVDERIQRFLAGDDIVHDRALFAYDLRASIAHAEGLAHIGILTADELDVPLLVEIGAGANWMNVK